MSTPSLDAPPDLPCCCLLNQTWTKDATADGVKTCDTAIWLPEVGNRAKEEDGERARCMQSDVGDAL